MWKHIITQALYQFVTLLLVYQSMQVPDHLTLHVASHQCTSPQHQQVDEHARCELFSATPLGNSGAPTCCGYDVPCDQAQGGAYLPAEPPLCRWTNDDMDECALQLPVLATVCPSALEPCPRFLQLQAWVARASKAWEAYSASQALQANTMVFNAFIFMQVQTGPLKRLHVQALHSSPQVFNMINARTLYDELNVFRGIGKGGLFLGLLSTMIVCQLFIVQVMAPVFKIVPQRPLQWLAAIALGAGGLVVALLVKLVSRQSVMVAGAAWAAHGWSRVSSAVSSALAGVGAALGARRWGGRWSRLETAPARADPSHHKADQAPLPLSHSSHEGSQRALMQSPSRQWGCWSTLTGSGSVGGSGTYSRQASSLSPQGSSVVLTAVDG